MCSKLIATEAQISVLETSELVVGDFTASDAPLGSHLILGVPLGKVAAWLLVSEAALVCCKGIIVFNMGWINKVDMVCLSPVGYGV